MAVADRVAMFEEEFRRNEALKGRSVPEFTDETRSLIADAMIGASSFADMVRRVARVIGI